MQPPPTFSGLPEFLCRLVCILTGEVRFVYDCMTLDLSSRPSVYFILTTKVQLNAHSNNKNIIYIKETFLLDYL